MYSQTCVQRPPSGPPKNGLCSEVVAIQRVIKFSSTTRRCPRELTEGQARHRDAEEFRPGKLAETEMEGNLNLNNL
jgi:hypothetical protein